MSRPLSCVAVTVAASLAVAHAATLGPMQPWPQLVHTQVALITAGTIDAVEQSFEAEFYITLIWRDDSVNTSLPFNPKTNFWPAIEFTNLATSSSSIEWDFHVGTWFNVPPRLVLPAASTGTWISAFARVTGEFSVPVTLPDFPQDRQRLTIRLQSRHYNASYLNYTAIPGTAALMVPPQMDIIGWKILRSDVETYKHFVPAFEQSWAELRAFVDVERLSAYYLNRLVANCALLVFMSFFSTSLRPDVPERTVVTITAWLGLTTWQLIIVSETPRVGYLTRIDSFLNLSFGVVFALVLSHAINYVIFEVQHTKVAKAKQESMAKLQKTLERLAARGDPGAQALLSVRLPPSVTAAYAKPQSAGGGTTPKAGAKSVRTVPPAQAWGEDNAAGAGPSSTGEHHQTATAGAVTFAHVASPSPPTPASDPEREDANGDGHAVTVKSVQGHDMRVDTQAAPANAEAAGRPYLMLSAQNQRMNPEPPAETEDDIGPAECARGCPHPKQTWRIMTRAWDLTTTARKCDVLITLVAAVFYIVALGYIFLRPPSLIPDVDTR